MGIYLSSKVPYGSFFGLSTQNFDYFRFSQLKMEEINAHRAICTGGLNNLCIVSSIFGHRNLCALTISLEQCSVERDNDHCH